MSEADAAPAEDRLPWLADEAEPVRDAPYPRRHRPRGRRRFADLSASPIGSALEAGRGRASVPRIRRDVRLPPCRCPTAAAGGRDAA